MTSEKFEAEYRRVARAQEMIEGIPRGEIEAGPDPPDCFICDARRRKIASIEVTELIDEVEHRQTAAIGRSGAGTRWPGDMISQHEPHSAVREIKKKVLEENNPFREGLRIVIVTRSYTTKKQWVQECWKAISDAVTDLKRWTDREERRLPPQLNVRSNMGLGDAGGVQVQVRHDPGKTTSVHHNPSVVTVADNDGWNRNGRDVTVDGAVLRKIIERKAARLAKTRERWHGEKILLISNALFPGRSHNSLATKELKSGIENEMFNTHGFDKVIVHDQKGPRSSLVVTADGTRIAGDLIEWS